MTNNPILLTAGGTGGHVFPAEALAEALISRGHNLGFVTDRRGTKYSGSLSGIANYPIRAGGIAGRSAISRLKAVGELLMGSLQALLLVQRLKPKVVIGFGGYASFPMVLAASLMGVPTVLHEQNAVLGRANRLLANFASKIAISFPTISKLRPSWKDKTVITGMPVRTAIASNRNLPYPAIGENIPIKILVLGGSQGARILSDVIPSAIASLPREIRQRLAVSQQCRQEDLEKVCEIYRNSNVTADLASFFNDVPSRLLETHLVISRSGASTMAELMVSGRPAILIPYQHAIDDHQTANALALDQAGGAWLIPQSSFTTEVLAEKIMSLVSTPSLLSEAAEKSRHAGIANAADILADLVESQFLTEKTQ